jgi:hypothetical protein
MSLTPEEVRAHIERVPLPNTAAKASDDDLSTACLAHAFLVLCEEDSTLLEVPSDPTGLEQANNRELWLAFTRRWPQGDEWLGGVSGFQFFGAHNAVRYVLGAEQVGIPTI